MEIKQSNLGKELFELVQADQGASFISDTVEDMTDEEVIRIAILSLKFTNRTARKLIEFLREHVIKEP